jgi:hypothetical protein
MRKTGHAPEFAGNQQRCLIVEGVTTDRASDKNLDRKSRAERGPDRRRAPQTQPLKELQRSPRITFMLQIQMKWMKVICIMKNVMSQEFQHCSE